MLIKVEDDYLQTNECDKHNTELKDYESLFIKMSFFYPIKKLLSRVFTTPINDGIT